MKLLIKFHKFASKGCHSHCDLSVIVITPRFQLSCVKCEQWLIFFLVTNIVITLFTLRWIIFNVEKCSTVVTIISPCGGASASLNVKFEHHAIIYSYGC